MHYCSKVWGQYFYVKYGMKLIKIGYWPHKVISGI